MHLSVIRSAVGSHASAAAMSKLSQHPQGAMLFPKLDGSILLMTLLVHRQQEGCPCFGSSDSSRGPSYICSGP